jgi:hypothetical protein
MKLSLDFLRADRMAWPGLQQAVFVGRFHANATLSSGQTGVWRGWVLKLRRHTDKRIVAIATLARDHWGEI